MNDVKDALSKISREKLLKWEKDTQKILNFLAKEKFTLDEASDAFCSAIGRLDFENMCEKKYEIPLGLKTLKDCSSLSIEMTEGAYNEYLKKEKENE